MRRASVPMTMVLGLCVLMALARQGRTQDEEDRYAKANPQLAKWIKDILKLDKDVRMREIAFGDPKIKGLKAVYRGELTKNGKDWQIVRYATDRGDLLELDKNFEPVGPRVECGKGGITEEDVKKLLKNVK